MANVDQRRFNNQVSDFLSAREAAARLDVKLPTLYAYVSRGLVRSVAGAAGRPRRYLRADVDRLVARRNARRGHGAVAAGALRWGEPVLDSAITELAETGPRYRGHDAVALADAGLRFEAVAELLWTGERGAAGSWRPRPLPAGLPRQASPLERMAAAVPLLAAADPDRHALAGELDRARSLLAALARVAGGGAGDDDDSIAAAALRGFTGRAPRAARARAIDRALIVLADHELNVSTFAARVTASAGADIYACVSAALAALSGPRHGGACDRVELLLDEAGDPRGAAATIRRRLRAGDSVPGFGHRLYADGDPRTGPLLADAARLAPRSPAVTTGAALARAMARDTGGGLAPTVDLGLVVLARALRLPAGAATALFALGRAAGWVAHAREQRDAGFMLRPRARFVGVAKRSASSKGPEM